MFIKKKKNSIMKCLSDHPCSHGTLRDIMDKEGYKGRKYLGATSPTGGVHGEFPES